MALIFSFFQVAGMSASAWGVPFGVGGDPRVDPADFRITTFTAGLDFPIGLQELPDGSILVGNSVSTGSLFASSHGELLRFEDSDSDGVADGPGAVLFTGLPGLVTSVRLVGDLVVVASSKRGAQRISILRQGAAVSDPYTLEGFIDLDFPAGNWKHSSFSTAVRETGTDQFEVFFNIGSQFNAASATLHVTLSGMTSGVLNGDSIYRVSVDDTGSAPTVFGLEQISTGLRNAWGMAFEPATGDLYLQDNGIDDAINPSEPVSVDELNRIAAIDLGGVVEDFGFSDRYVEYRTGNTIGAGGVPPLVTFQPLPPPNGSESEGPVEITFAPTGYPAGLNDGIFVGFHGEYSKAGVANGENPLVYVDLSTGQYFDFVANTEPAIGHLNSLLATGDSLFAADLSSAGDIWTSGNGVIYQIRANSSAVPGLGPGAIATVIVLLLVFAVARHTARG